MAHGLPLVLLGDIAMEGAAPDSTVAAWLQGALATWLEDTSRTCQAQVAALEASIDKCGALCPKTLSLEPAELHRKCGSKAARALQGACGGGGGTGAAAPYRGPRAELAPDRAHRDARLAPAAQPGGPQRGRGARARRAHGLHAAPHDEHQPARPLLPVCQGAAWRFVTIAACDACAIRNHHGLLHALASLLRASCQAINQHMGRQETRNPCKLGTRAVLEEPPRTEIAHAGRVSARRSSRT